MALDGASVEGAVPQPSGPEVTPNDPLSQARSAWFEAKRQLDGASDVDRSQLENDEKQTLTAFAEKVMAQEIPTDPTERLQLQVDIEDLFSDQLARTDGHVMRSSLAAAITSKMISVDSQIPGRGIFAIQTAEMAHMPPDVIADLKKKFRPNLGQKVARGAGQAYQKVNSPYTRFTRAMVQEERRAIRGISQALRNIGSRGPKA